jgi:hypothetical protein
VARSLPKAFGASRVLVKRARSSNGWPLGTTREEIFAPSTASTYVI